MSASFIVIVAYFPALLSLSFSVVTTMACVLHTVCIGWLQGSVYPIRVSPHIHLAMRTMGAARTLTVFHCYKCDSALEFMIKEERDEIIRVLSSLKEPAKKRV